MGDLATSAIGDPSGRSIADVAVDPDYSLAERYTGVNGVGRTVVRHQESDTYWECHFVERSFGEDQFEERQWCKVEPPPNAPRLRSLDEARAARATVIRAVADLLAPIHGAEAKFKAALLVDGAWRSFIRSCA